MMVFDLEGGASYSIPSERGQTRLVPGHQYLPAHGVSTPYNVRRNCT